MEKEISKNLLKSYKYRGILIREKNSNSSGQGDMRRHKFPTDGDPGEEGQKVREPRRRLIR